MKRHGLVLALSLTAVAIGLASVATGEQSGPWYEPGSLSNRPLEYGNIREGYELFRANCKQCHFRGNEANAPFLCPELKTKNAWNRVFARDNRTVEANGCLKDLSAEQLMDLNDYLYTHAKDSRNPNDEMECGI